MVNQDGVIIGSKSQKDSQEQANLALVIIHAIPVEASPENVLVTLLRLAMDYTKEITGQS